jgi:hypothetical protein
MINGIGRKSANTCIQACIIAAVLWVAAGCRTDTALSIPDLSQAGIENILILPLTDLTQIYGVTGMIKCPLCAHYFEAGRVLKIAGQILSEELISHVNDHTGFGIDSNYRAASEMDPAALDQRLFDERGYLIRTGRTAQADAVLTGYVYRFEQRVGNRFSADAPASVAFSVHMIRVSDGQDLWYGYYDETQAALNEDLFQLKTFLDRKASWITAEEMATSGLQKILKGFPKQ